MTILNKAFLPVAGLLASLAGPLHTYADESSPILKVAMGGTISDKLDPTKVTRYEIQLNCNTNEGIETKIVTDKESNQVISSQDCRIPASAISTIKSVCKSTSFADSIKEGILKQVSSDAPYCPTWQSGDSNKTYTAQSMYPRF